MRNKIIKAIAVGLMLTMNLTACGRGMTENRIITSQEQINEVIPLKLWGAQEDHELLTYLIEGFKQQYADEAIFDITLEVRSEVECKPSILQDVNAAPDIFIFPDDQLMTFASAGVLEPITYEEEIRTRNLEGAVEAASINNKVYAYPLTADNSYFMYYNKNYFSEEDVKSLDRMLEIAEQHNKKIAIDMSNAWYLYAFFGNTGLTIGLNDDYTTNYCTWNATDGEIKGVDIVESLKKITSSKGFIDVGDTDFISGVQDGTIIAGINGVWNAVEVEKAWKEGYAATKLPTYTVAGKSVQMSSYVGYKVLGVNSRSKNVEWAERLAEYLSNEQSQMERFKQRRQGPSNINAANSEEVNESVAIAALLEQSEFGSVQRVGELYWKPVTELGQMISKGDLKGMTNQQALDRAVQQITSKKVKEDFK